MKIRLPAPLRFDAESDEWTLEPKPYRLTSNTFRQDDVKTLRDAALLLEDLGYLRSGRPDVLRSLADRLAEMLAAFDAHGVALFEGPPNPARTDA